MIIEKRGDIFTSQMSVITNPVNTVGIMGKGLALQYKKKYPAMFSYYQNLCFDGSLEVGRPILWKGTDKYVLLFPTKKHWRNSSQYIYIDNGLTYLVNSILPTEPSITGLALPLLGTGFGGLNKKVVSSLIQRILNNVNIQVEIFI